MAHYEAEIDLGNPNASHTQVVDLVGRGKAVLDVGCATGYLARALKDRDCTVSGLEVDPAMAEVARQHLDEVVEADLNATSLTDLFRPGSFDVVIFADVLEHVLEPERVLREAIPLLRPGGRIVISIPNVSHGSVRLALLQGRWEYVDAGLLDRTHVWFYTRGSLIALVEGAGLAVEHLRGVVVDPLVAPVRIDASALPRTVIEWVRRQPDALHYQYIAAARVLDADETAPVAPAVVPAVAPQQVQQNDIYTQELVQLESDLHELLTTRDHVIGLESQLALVTEKEAHARGALKRAQKNNAALRRAYEDSTTWRAGRLLTSPIQSIRSRRKGRA